MASKTTLARLRTTAAVLRNFQTIASFASELEQYGYKPTEYYDGNAHLKLGMAIQLPLDRRDVAIGAGESFQSTMESMLATMAALAMLYELDEVERMARLVDELNEIYGRIAAHRGKRIVDRKAKASADWYIQRLVGAARVINQRVGNTEDQQRLFDAGGAATGGNAYG